MDFTKLSQLTLDDLKNIDGQQVAHWIKKRLDVAVMGGVILVTAVVSIAVLSQRMAEKKRLEREMAKAEKKLKAIRELEKVDESLQALLATIPPPLSSEALVGRLTDWAVQRGVRIESFSPARKEQREHYDLTSVHIEVSAADFASIWLLVHDIETSGLPIRIDMWDGRLVSASSGSLSAEGGEARVGVSMEIVSLAVQRDDSKKTRKPKKQKKP